MDQAQASEAPNETFAPPAIPLVLANASQGPPSIGAANKNEAASGDDQSSVQMSAPTAPALTQMAQVGRTMWSGYSNTSTQSRAAHSTVSAGEYSDSQTSSVASSRSFK
jgi:hypothetical protein